jgi:XrtJ-associated TM-motif-TM protein
MGQIATEENTMRSFKYLLAIGIVLIATSPLYLHAQTGCDDSPENPTAVLALLGSVAAFGMHARRRFLADRANRKKDQ